MDTQDQPPAVTVRLTGVEDAPAVARVLAEAFAAYEPRYTPAAFVATTPTADQVLARWAEGPVWVAVRAGRVRGTVAAVHDRPDLHVRSMGVVPRARGQAVGTGLLEHVEQYARLHRSRRVRLSTTPFLADAIRLYENSGFARTADGPHALFGTPLVTMVKVLRPEAGPSAPTSDCSDRETP